MPFYPISVKQICSKKKNITAVLCFSLLITLSVFLIHPAMAAEVEKEKGTKKKVEKKEVKKKRAPRAVPVSVAEVEEREVRLALKMVGSTIPFRKSKVAAQMSGVVSAVHFEPGQMVLKGAKLVSLDRSNILLSIKAAKSVLSTSELRLAEARKKLTRSSTLKETNAISQTGYETDLFKVRTLELDLVRVKSELERLNRNLRLMTVHAPFQGFVINKKTEIGQWIRTGEPVALMVDLSKIIVEARLPERYIEEVKQGMRVLVSFDALGGQEFEGIIDSVLPVADVGSRTFPLQISLPNPDLRIKGGLLARVSISGNSRIALLIPKDALVLDKGKASVIVIRKNKTRQITVKIGQAYGHMVEITGRVKKGDKVVVKGNERLYPGQTVKIVFDESEKRTEKQ